MICIPCVTSVSCEAVSMENTDDDNSMVGVVVSSSPSTITV